MTKFYYPLILLGLSVGLNAQSFTEVTTKPFGNFYYSASAVGDVDGDGSSDIVITGGVETSKGVWQGKGGGVYQSKNANLEPYRDLATYATNYGDIKFIDVDNDGLQDLIITGLDSNNAVKKYVLKNTKTSWELLSTNEGALRSNIEVFDFNHDGYQDYAISGRKGEYTGVPTDFDLYLNNKNDFTVQDRWIDGIFGGSFKFIDINNDTELDLVMAGFSETGAATFKVFTNNNGVYNLTQTLHGVANGKLDYADFDGDGFLDLVFIGQDEDYDPFLAFYFNDGTGNFAQNVIVGAGLTSGQVAVGDINNDGYYDFVVKGVTSSYGGNTKAYIYDPANRKFTLKTAASLNVMKLAGSNGYINLFDYNGDNKLDMLISGEDKEDWEYLPVYTKLYQNNITETNEKPTPPTQLSHREEGDRIIFEWFGATDDKTPVGALRYELSVGSTAGASDIAKYVVTTPKWYLKKQDLPKDLFWSVKAIDAGFVYSDASSEKKSTLGTNENSINNSVKIINPVKDNLIINGINKIQKVEIYNTAGQKVKTLYAGQSNVSNLEKGLYIVKIILPNSESIVQKIVKE